MPLALNFQASLLSILEENPLSASRARSARRAAGSSGLPNTNVSVDRPGRALFARCSRVVLCCHHLNAQDTSGIASNRA